MTDNIKIYDKIVFDSDSSTIHFSEACQRCSEDQFKMRSNPTAAQQKCDLCKAIKGYISNPTIKADLEAHINGLIDQPASTLKNHERAIETELGEMNNEKSNITDKKTTLAALKKRIELKHSILAAYPSKIKSTMSDLNSNIAQTELNTKDKIAIGVPILPTFFNVTSTTYVITFIALSILVFSLIIVLVFSDLLGKRMTGQ